MSANQRWVPLESNPEVKDNAISFNKAMNLMFKFLCFIYIGYEQGN